MMQRDDIGGWLSGPGASKQTNGVQQETYAGQRLGRPQSGSGSMAGLGRRVPALAIDWALSVLIGYGVMRPLNWGQMAPLAALLTMNVLLVGTVGNTIGHRLLGIRVETVDGAPPGPIKALGRSLLLCLAFPPLIWDADQRGMHDKAVGTLIVRR